MRRMNLIHPGMRRSAIILALALVSLLVYAALVLRFPTETYIRIPRTSVGSATNREPVAAVLLACAGLLLHGAYVAAVLLCWRSPNARSLFPLLWGYAIAAGTMLVLIWPITSTDIFDYIFRGHMAAHYGANPYIQPPNRYRGDPLFTYLGWPNAPSAYGPLWEMLSARMGALAGSSVWRNILLHKALALLTFLLCGAVIVRMTKERGAHAQLLGGLLWLASPLALWEIVAIGHNDGLLVLSMLLAIWATTYGRHRWAAIALVVGALFKFLPLILLPLVVVHGMRQRDTWPARIRLAAEIAVLSAVLIVVAYIPYWQGWPTLDNIALRERLLNAAPLAILIHTLAQWLPGDLVRTVVSRAGSALLVAGLLWQMWHIWQEGRDLRTACFGLLTWYLVIASQWFQPWYVLWLLALLALQPSREHFAWIETWALAGQASYLLQYFILAWLRWRGNQLPAQLLYLLIIFVPPLIVWSIGRWQARSHPPDLSSSEPVLAS